MDIDKMINVSMDMMDAVTDAVNRGDFSDLNSTLQRMIRPGTQQGSWAEYTEAERRREQEMRQRQAAQRARQAQQAEEARRQAQAQQQAYTASQTYAAPENGAKAATEDFTNAAKKAGNFLIDNSLVIYHKCREVVELPMIVALAILILLFQISIPAAIVAMFFDVSYQFRGPQLGRGKFNFVLDAVYGMVRKLKASIMNAQ